MIKTSALQAIGRSCRINKTIIPVAGGIHTCYTAPMGLPLGVKIKHAYKGMVNRHAVIKTGLVK